MGGAGSMDANRLVGRSSVEDSEASAHSMRAMAISQVWDTTGLGSERKRRRSGSEGECERAPRASPASWRTMGDSVRLERIDWRVAAAWWLLHWPRQ